MTKEKIETVYYAGAVNKFKVYGREFWTFKEALEYAEERENNF
jgi:hypothetical protein